MLKWVWLLVLTVHLAETLYLTEPAVFFHEKSAFELVPSGSSRDYDFGHSISYQKGENPRLLVGAPLYDLTGRVFQCPIKENSRTCDAIPIDLDEMHVAYNRTSSKNQHFYLGASIAATEQVFLTCAPLRTDYHYSEENKIYFGAYGTCFYYESGSGQHFKQYQGFGLEQDRKQNEALRHEIYGGLGWSTLVDEDNDMIIIAESFQGGSLVYGSISNISGDFKNTWRSKIYQDSIKADRDCECVTRKACRHQINQQSQLATLLKGLVAIGRGCVKWKLVTSQAMTSGNYFKNETHYALGVRGIDTIGSVVFLNSNLSIYWKLKTGFGSVGSMFGEALCSVDVTRDGLAELVVGAPAQVSDALSYDRGAIHVYSKTEPPAETKMGLIFTILGEKDGARFGTTLSSNDVDGDSYPEIIVSAPYEDSGVGALYIFCGFELYETMRLWRVSERVSSQTVSVSGLKRTQRIEKTSLKSFGFSMQPVPDFNDNGSDELSVGAPDNSTVTVYKGVRAITVNVTSKFPQDIKPDADHKYTYSSCVAVDLPPKPNATTTELLVKDTVRGRNASIAGPDGDTKSVSYTINLSTDVGNKTKDNKTEYCRNYAIIIPSTGNVISEVSMVKNISTIKEFSNKWVTLSGQSNLRLPVPFQPCNCGGGNCSPNITVEFQWSGGSKTNYEVGLSRLETVRVIVRNVGTTGCNSCAVLRVSGARVDTLQCQDERTGEYECMLTSPFGPNSNQTIDIILKMDEISTEDENLQIGVEVYKTCDRSEEVPRLTFTVAYDFNPDFVFLDGSSTNRAISDTELLVDDEEIISDEQTYIISNNRSVTWKNVLAKVTAVNKAYILNFTMKQPDYCSGNIDTEKFTADCSLILRPFSTIKLILIATINKKEISQYFKDKRVTIESELVLQLSPNNTKSKTLTTVMELEKEQTVGHNKTLVVGIAVVVALIVLLIISIILYKLNFFKRKAKEELQELRQEIRRRSLRHRPSCADSQSPSRPNSNMDDIVIVDEPLDNPTPMSAQEMEEVRAHEANAKRARAQSHLD